MGVRASCSLPYALSFDGRSRRGFLRAAAGGLLAPLLGAQRKAEVSSFDLSLLDGPLTPNDLFFIRDHFPPPETNPQKWTLAVGGAVAKGFSLSYEELLALPRQTVAATLECAENPVGGGLVSHAEWTGVALAELLRRAEPGAEGKFVRLAGPGGYARTIPLEKALHAATLLAHRMNGERLPREHGFPVRAVVPGWYAMDSVKWLERIEVLAGPDGGRWMTERYVRRVRSLLAGSRTEGEVRAVLVKSVFSRPAEGAILQGRRFVVRGAAWAGESAVAQVEVSADGGGTWGPARRTTAVQPFSWMHWEYLWTIPGPGEYELVARAGDDQGRQQPLERAAERLDDYEQNACQRVRVRVA